MFLFSPRLICVKKIFSFIVKWIKKSILASVLLVISHTVQAATFTISTPTTDGTFTLSWSDARTFAELYEVINGSRQKIGGQYLKTYSLTYTKVPGTYTYIMVDVLAYGCPSCPGGTAYNRTEIQRTVVVPVTNVAPVIPATITVTPNHFDESISVSWGQSTGASRYELERNGANVYSGLATNSTQSNLQIGTGYTFRVRACNAYGCSDWRTANSAALSETFSVPSNNITGQYSISVVTPPNYSHTRIEERAGTGGSWAELTILGSSGSQSYTVTRSNGTYYYRLSYCYFNNQSQTCTPRNSERSIVVNQPAPTISASFLPATINEGGTSVLSWNATNATTCSATGISGVSGINGSVNYTASSVMSANTTATITINCSGGGGNSSKNATVNINWVNDAPVISGISSRSINEDTSTGAIGFTVVDEETAPALLDVSAISDNQNLIPDGNIQLTNSGTNRTITIVPAANQSGSAKITVKVTDAHGASTTTEFFLTVNAVDDAPVISVINNVSMNELGTATVNFTVTDIDSPVSGVTVSSDSTSIVTPVLSGSDNSYSVTLTAGTITTNSSSLSATITVMVPFSPTPVTRSFTATVNNVNPQLWITDSGTIGVYTLNWNFGTAATKIFQNGADITTLIDPSGYAPISGSKQITKAANGTFNYYISDCVRGTQGSLSCSGSYSPVSKTVTFPVPTVTASFNKASVNEANAGATNTTAELTWNSTNADSCSASGITGVGASSGSLTYTAPANLITNQTHKVIVTCTGKGGPAQDDAELALVALNDQPTISAIASPVVFNEDETKSISVTVGDEETAAASLIVTAVSDNQSLIPDSNIQLINNGTNRTITLVPVANQSGTAKITLKVTDENDAFVTTEFNITVNDVDDAPIISDIPVINVNEGATSDWQSFTITDIDTLSELEVAATTNGSALVSDSNIYLEKTGSNTYRIAVKVGGRISTGGIDHELVNVQIVVSGGSPTPVPKIFPVKVNNLPAQLTAPELSTSGLYEVKWDYAAYGVRIFENGADITHLIHSSGTAPKSGSRAFSKHESGIYNYAIKDCVYGQNGTLICDQITDTKSVQVSLSAPVAPTLNSPPTSNTGEYVVTWTVIPGVINYKLYENDQIIHNSASTFKAFQATNRKGSGTYQYKVQACIFSCSEFSNIQTTVVTIASSSSRSSSSFPSSSFSSLSSSSASSKSSSSLSSLNRRVIFIHTDLLGSPAAETNAEGNANE